MVSRGNLSLGVLMYQIVCVTGETDRRSTVASGFCDEAEAWETAQNWINRRFLDAAYDHSKGMLVAARFTSPNSSDRDR
jgi:hypothetical protein